VIIEENQLRPPSPKEMARRRVPLERMSIDYEIDWDRKCASPDKLGACDCPKTEGSAVSNPTYGVTTLELIEFHKDNAVPYEATLESEGDDGELWLDWSHLSYCPVCQGWYREGDDQDHLLEPIHVAVVKARMSQFLPDENEGLLLPHVETVSAATLAGMALVGAARNPEVFAPWEDDEA
jgi:hypothetical protein